MAFEADKVVVELIAKNEQFDTKMQQSAQTFDAAMDKIGGSSTKAEKAVTKGSSARVSAVQKESQAISRAASIIGTQINDIGGLLTGPKSPLTVVPAQTPKVTGAFKMIGLAAGAAGGILGGVLVTGAISGAAALLELAFATDDTTKKINELVEKLKENAEKAELSDRANEIFAQTLEGVTDAIRDEDAALKKLNDQHKTAARIQLENALRRLDTLKGLRDETQATLEAAKAQIELNRQRAQFADKPGLRTAILNEAEAGVERVAEMEKRLGKIDGLITKTQGRLADALSRRIVERQTDLTDPIKVIEKRYDNLIEQARQRAIAEGTVQTTLAAQTKELLKQKDAAIEAERAKQRASRSTRDPNRQSGRQITEAEARAIVAGIGGTVTSGFRTPEHNQRVGGQATSFHLKGQAIDIAKTAGLTLGKIVQAFEKQGVKLIEKLDEGDHFHIAWSRRGAGRSVDPQRIADAEERRAQAFQNELAQMQEEELQARQALITSAEEIAQLELASIEISRAKYEDNVKSLVEQRKLRDDEAKELLKLNEERARLRTELVKRREDERKFRLAEQQERAKLDVQAAGLQDAQAVLQSQQDLARTRKERSDIERKLLDLQFQEERIALEAIIKHNDRLKLQDNIAESERIEAEAAAKIAEIRLASLEQRKANAKANEAQANASPLDQYFGDLQKEAGDINDAFESIAAGGLRSLTDGLTDAILGFRSFGDVGRQVLAQIAAGLVKLAIQQIILSTVGKAIGQAATAATATQAAATAAAWAPAAAAASLATLGTNAGPAAAALISTHALSTALAAAAGFAGAGGKKDGGRIRGPGSSVSDDVPIWASNDEFMIRANAARTIGYEALEHINRTGKLPGFASGGRIRRQPSNEKAIAPAGSGFAPQDLSSLRGIIGEAVAAGISAMPDVSLYASLDPVDVLQRALGTPAGQKALVTAIGANSTRVKSAIR